MNFLSSKSTLQGYLDPYLSDYITSQSDMTIEVGIFDGTVVLEDVVLKPREVGIVPGINLRLESGSIDRLQVQIPWSTINPVNVLGFGQKWDLNVTVDRVNVASRIVLVEEELDRNDSTTQFYLQKVRDIIDEEKEMFGNSPTLWTSFMQENLFHGWEKHLNSKFSASVDLVKISCLFPVDHGREMLVNMNIEALDIDQQDPHESNMNGLSTAETNYDDGGSSEEEEEDSDVDDEGGNEDVPSIAPRPLTVHDVTIRGFEVLIGCNLIEDGDVAKISNLSLQSQDIFLNPTHILAKVSKLRSYDCFRNDELTVYAGIERPELPQPRDFYTLEAQTSNIEFTPKLRQLSYMRKFLDLLQLKSRRWQCAHLHPSSIQIFRDPLPENNSAEEEKKGGDTTEKEDLNNFSGNGNIKGYPARLWWQYAIGSVMLLNKNKRNIQHYSVVKLSQDFRDISSGLPDTLTRSMVYMRLYHQYFLSLMFKDSPNFPPLKNGELVLMVLLQHMFTQIALARIRKAVYIIIRRKYSISTMMEALDGVQNDLAALQGIALCQGDDPVDLLRRMCNICFELSKDYTNSTMVEVRELYIRNSFEGVRWNIRLDFTRLAIVVLQTNSQSNNSTKGQQIYDRTFTMALYKMNTSVHCLRDGKLYVVKNSMSSIRAFGYGNMEIFGCGDDPNVVMNSSRTKNSKRSLKAGRQIALDYEIDLDRQVVNTTNTSNLVGHLYSSLAVKRVYFTWDFITIEFLKEVCGLMNVSLGMQSRFIESLDGTVNPKKFDTLGFRRKNEWAFSTSLDIDNISLSLQNLSNPSPSSGKSSSHHHHRRRGHGHQYLDKNDKHRDRDAAFDDSYIVFSAASVVYKSGRWFELHIGYKTVVITESAKMESGDDLKVEEDITATDNYYVHQLAPTSRSTKDRESRHAMKAFADGFLTSTWENIDQEVLRVGTRHLNDKKYCTYFRVQSLTVSRWTLSGDRTEVLRKASGLLCLGGLAENDQLFSEESLTTHVPATFEETATALMQSRIGANELEALNKVSFWHMRVQPIFVDITISGACMVLDAMTRMSALFSSKKKIIISDFIASEAVSQVRKNKRQSQLNIQFDRCEIVMGTDRDRFSVVESLKDVMRKYVSQTCNNNMNSRRTDAYKDLVRFQIYYLLGRERVYMGIVESLLADLDHQGNAVIDSYLNNEFGFKGGVDDEVRIKPIFAVIVRNLLLCKDTYACDYKVRLQLSSFKVYRGKHLSPVISFKGADNDPIYIDLYEHGFNAASQKEMTYDFKKAIRTHYYASVNANHMSFWIDDKSIPDMFLNAMKTVDTITGELHRLFRIREDALQELHMVLNSSVTDKYYSHRNKNKKDSRLKGRNTVAGGGDDSSFNSDDNSSVGSRTVGSRMSVRSVHSRRQQQQQKLQQQQRFASISNDRGYDYGKRSLLGRNTKLAAIDNMVRYSRCTLHSTTENETGSMFAYLLRGNPIEIARAAYFINNHVYRQVEILLSIKIEVKNIDVKFLKGTDMLGALHIKGCTLQTESTDLTFSNKRSFDLNVNDLDFVNLKSTARHAQCIWSDKGDTVPLNESIASSKDGLTSATTGKDKSNKTERPLLVLSGSRDEKRKDNHISSNLVVTLADLRMCLIANYIEEFALLASDIYQIFCKVKERFCAVWNTCRLLQRSILDEKVLLTHQTLKGIEKIERDRPYGQQSAYTIAPPSAVDVYADFGAAASGEFNVQQDESAILARYIRGIMPYETPEASWMDYVGLLKWDVVAYDTQIVIPRNSDSGDMMALTFKSGKLRNEFVETSWIGPSVRQLDFVKKRNDWSLRFDSSANAWMVDRSGASSKKLKVSKTRMRLDSADSKDKDRDTEIDASTSRKDKKKDKSPNKASVFRIHSEVCKIAVYSSFGNRENLTSDISMTMMSVKANEKVYTSKSDNRDSNSNKSSQVFTQRWRLINKVNDKDTMTDMPTYLNLLCLTDSMLMDTEDDYKHRILITDMEKVDRAELLHFDVTLAEFYLMLSLFYDNFNETKEREDDEVGRSDDMGETHHNSNKENTSLPSLNFDSEDFWAAVERISEHLEVMVVRGEVNLNLFVEFEKYRDLLPHFHLLHADSVLQDTWSDLEQGNHHLFDRYILHPSAVSNLMNDSLLYTEFVRDFALPLVNVQLGNSIFHMKSDSVIETSTFSTSKFRMLDSRLIYQKAPIVFSVVERDSGKNRSGSSVNSSVFSGIYSESFPVNWARVTYQRHAIMQYDFLRPNALIDGLDMLKVLADFGTCYILYPGFQNPHVDKMYIGGERPVTSNQCQDVRVLMKNPHICVTEDLKVGVAGGLGNRTLVFETDQQIFFKRVFDRAYNSKVDLVVDALAIVVHDTYAGPKIARSLREPTSISGHLRTLLDSLDLKYHFNFVTDLMHADVQLYCARSSTGTSKAIVTSRRQGATGTIIAAIDTDMNACIHFFVQGFRHYLYSLNVVPPFIEEPKCIFSVNSGNRRGGAACSIVLAFEDLQLILGIANKMILSKSSTAKGSEMAIRRGSFGAESKTPEQLLEALGKGDFTNSISDLVQSPFTASLPAHSIYLLTRFENIHLKWVDSVLGPHLPYLKLDLKRVESGLLFDRSHVISPRGETPLPIVHRKRSAEVHSNTAPSNMIGELADDTARRARSFSQFTVGLQYFNNVKKCWEPALENMTASLLFEDLNGKGFTWRSNTPMNITFSTALLHVINDIHVDLSGKNNMWLVSRPQSSESIHSATAVPVEEEDICAEAHNPGMKGVRAAYSIVNSTGRPIRFIHRILDDSSTQRAQRNMRLKKLETGKMSSLNFVATESHIRNNRITQEPFRKSSDKDLPKDDLEKTVTVQAKDFDWIKNVSSHELGVCYHSASKALMRKNFVANHPDLSNALQLVSDVYAYGGGRVLELRSTFTISNLTNHDVMIYSNTVDPEEGFENHDGSTSFLLERDNEYHLPLSLLHESVASSKGKSLGYLVLKPHSVSDEEGQNHELGMGSFEASDRPIRLKTIVKNSKEWLMRQIQGSVSVDALRSLTGFQLECLRKDQNTSHIGGIEASHGNVFYRIEIERKGYSGAESTDNASEETHGQVLNLLQNFTGRLFRGRNQQQEMEEALRKAPIDYLITIHPPIVIENFLPMMACFELVHAETATVLWSGEIAAIDKCAIHTVSMKIPLAITISIPNYCKTREPMKIHNPYDSKEQAAMGDFNSVSTNGNESYVDDWDAVSDAIYLYDVLSQKLRLNIENELGRGGQRNISVFCPYWIVNQSQYSIRLREEGVTKDQMPAGTIRETKKRRHTHQPSGYKNKEVIEEGTGHGMVSIKAKTGRASQDDNEALDIFYERSEYTDMLFEQCEDNDGEDEGSSDDEMDNEQRIRPGKEPKLFNRDKSVHPCLGKMSPVTKYNEEVNLENIVTEELLQLSYLFNYHEHRAIGKRRVLIQLDDSDWSLPVSFDSIGTPLYCRIEHGEQGLYETGYKIKTAPGKLSKYTKIVHFMPRFFLTNKLDVDVHFMQPTGFFGDTEEWRRKAQMLVKSHNTAPMHLPDPFSERTLCIQHAGSYYKTVYFKIDDIGTHTIRVDKKVDLTQIQHVNSRDMLEYTIVIPVDVDLGIYFETDYSGKDIVVKELVKNHWAYNDTEIQVGDVMINIDGTDVTGEDENFDQAMDMLRHRAKNVKVRFRTVEENIRLVREAAMAEKSNDKRKTSQLTDIVEDQAKDKVLRLDIRQVEACIFVVVDEVTESITPGYRLKNNSFCHYIYYKQRGVVGNNWCCLPPCSETSYAWEDPFNPNKVLLVHVGKNLLSPRLKAQVDSDFISTSHNLLEGAYQCLPGKQEEKFTKIPLDNAETMRHTISLPNGSEGSLLAELSIHGSIKILSIRPNPGQHFAEVKYCVEFAKLQAKQLRDFTPSVKMMMDNYFDENRNLLANNHADNTELSGNLGGFDMDIDGGYGLEPLDMGMIGAPVDIDDEAILTKLQSLLINTQHDIQDGLQVILDGIRQIENMKLSDDDAADVDNDDVPKLDSYLPYESVFGECIQNRHQVEVEVVEAKELLPSASNRPEDVWCSIEILDNMNFAVLAIDNMKEEFGITKKKRHTTVCEENMNPTWVGQRFLFDVDENAVDLKREFRVRVTVFASSEVRLQDKIIGHADMQFTMLKKEELVEGWFPLRPNKPKITDVENYETCGSVYLKIQWIHSLFGLLSYTHDLALGRIKLLEDCAAKSEKEFYRICTQDHFTKHKNKIDEKMWEVEDHALFDPLLLNQKDMGTRNGANDNNNDLDPLEPSKLVHTSSIKTMRRDGADDNLKSTKTISTTENLITLSTGRDLPKLTSYYDRGSLPHFHIFQRDPIKILESASFSDGLDRECYRSYRHIRTHSGELLMTAIRAYHIPDSKFSSVFVKVTYGGNEYVTATTSRNERDDGAEWVTEMTGDDTGGEANLISHAFRIGIETLNIKSDIKVEIIGHGYTRQKTLASVDIPVFNIIDAISLPNEASDTTSATYAYNAWFPLDTDIASINADGNKKTLIMSKECERIDYTDFAADAPCIKLRFAWKHPNAYNVDNPSEELVNTLNEARSLPQENLDMYWRVQLPYVSFSIVDSLNATQLMQVSVIGVESRYSLSRSYTDVSANMNWLQVDNQLSQASVGVILAPKTRKHPQPTLRIHTRKNNLLSNEHLNSYDTVQLVLQELDITLEQKTIVAFFLMIKGYKRERASDLNTSSALNTIAKTRSTTNLHALLSDDDDFARINTRMRRSGKGFGSMTSTAHRSVTGIKEFSNANERADSPLQGMEKEKSEEDNKLLESMNMTYIGYLNISPIKLNMNLLMSPAIHALPIFKESRMTRSGVAGDDLASTVKMFFSTIGAVTLDIANTITDSPVSFPLYEGLSVFETTDEVAKRLRDYYLYGALTQLYSIVGSLDIISNPIGLVASLGSGVKDFFYEPSNALITSPTEVSKLGKSLAKGTLSLVSNTADGLIGTGTTITRQFSKGVAKFAMDPNYNTLRDVLNRPARSLTDAASKPLKDVSYSIYYAVTGLLKVPYNNYRKYQLKGLPTGIVKGIAGVISKPVVGVLDAVTHTGEAVRHGIKLIGRDFSEIIYRIEFRKQFGPDGRILDHNYSTALGEYALLQIAENSKVDAVEKIVNAGLGLILPANFAKRVGGALTGCLPAGEEKEAGVLDGAGLAKDNTPAFFEDESPTLNVSEQNSAFLKGLNTESVIHCAMFLIETTKRTTSKITKFQLSKTVKATLLVIVTNFRVVVVEYLKKRHTGSLFTVKFQCPLNQLRESIIDLSSDESVGKSMKMSLSYDPTSEFDREFRNDDTGQAPFVPFLHGDSKEREYCLVCASYEEKIMKELYNCLLIVQTNGGVTTDQLISYMDQGDAFTLGQSIDHDPEMGVYRIGAWEFEGATTNDDNDSNKRRYDLYKQIRNLKWDEDLHIGEDSNKNKNDGALSPDRRKTLERTDPKEGGITGTAEEDGLVDSTPAGIDTITNQQDSMLTPETMVTQTTTTSQTDMAKLFGELDVDSNDEENDRRQRKKKHRKKHRKKHKRERDHRGSRDSDSDAF